MNSTVIPLRPSAAPPAKPAMLVDIPLGTATTDIGFGRGWAAPEPAADGACGKAHS